MGFYDSACMVGGAFPSKTKRRFEPGSLCRCNRNFLSSAWSWTPANCLHVISRAQHGLMIFIIIANSAFGLIAGYLYWKKGLESAIIAHMSAHLITIGASYTGVYF